jgi:hypothetical protein
MPSAICNTCGSIVGWKPGKGGLKKEVCRCGSNNLKAVAGRWNADFTGFEYYDRHGKMVKIVPRITENQIVAI